MKNLLTTIINNYPTNQPTKDLVHSNYMDDLVKGLRTPIGDFICFTDKSHSEDLDSTYEYYVSQGIRFTDTVSLLEMLESVASELRETNTKCKITIQGGVNTAEIYHCRGMKAVEASIPLTSDCGDRIRIKVEEITLEGE